jgi:hypothetical protein
MPLHRTLQTTHRKHIAGWKAARIVQGLVKKHTHGCGSQRSVFSVNGIGEGLEKPCYQLNWAACALQPVGNQTRSATTPTKITPDSRQAHCGDERTNPSTEPVSGRTPPCRCPVIRVRPTMGERLTRCAGRKGIVERRRATRSNMGQR